MAYLRGGRSSFPEGEDNFLELFDLSHNQLAAAKRLNELRLQDNLTNSEQNEVISLLASLRDNMINPEDMNLLGDAVYNLQKFFNEQVFGYILERQAEWDSYVKQFQYIGKWASGVVYKAQNLVHNTKGDLFIARRDHTSSGTEPIETNTNFAKLGVKGDKGDPGISAAFKGDWNAATNYLIGEAVIHVNTGVNGGLVYISRRANVGKNPATSPEDWILHTSSYVGATSPLGAQAGLHWIKVLN